jgi:hypothetical protein
MTDRELLRACRKALGYGTPRLTRALGLKGDGAVVRSWESGRAPVSGPVWVALCLLLSSTGHRALAEEVQTTRLATAWPTICQALRAA